MDKTRAMSIVHKFFPNVKTVKDAKRSIAITVTKQDTTSAEVRKHHECALAQACKRELHVDGAIISVSRAYLIKNGVATRYEVPAIIGREIVSFDRGTGFHTGVYVLGKITKDHKQGRKIKGGGQHTGTRTKARHFTSGIRKSLARV